ARSASAVTNSLDLSLSPATDPTSIHRYRDGLYAADLLMAAISHLDFFTWLSAHPATDLQTICRSLDLRERPADVMLTLFAVMGLLQTENRSFSLTDLAREHLVKCSPWNIAPYLFRLDQ